MSVHDGGHSNRFGPILGPGHAVRSRDGYAAKQVQGFLTSPDLQLDTSREDRVPLQPWVFAATDRRRVEPVAARSGWHLGVNVEMPAQCESCPAGGSCELRSSGGTEARHSQEDLGVHVAAQSGLDQPVSLSTLRGSSSSDARRVRGLQARRRAAGVLDRKPETTGSSIRAIASTCAVMSPFDVAGLANLMSATF